VYDIRCTVQNLGFRVQGLRFRVKSVGSRFHILGF
jgi:hypothetical protein